MSPYEPRLEALNIRPASPSVVKTLNIKTVTFDAETQQVVPKVPTEKMIKAAQADH
ncbi:hypothetical protein [Pandoraea sp. ISTKB]|uniref:hypothetical protein n=1 Tax=Pandoraea sp. ISTKB TaxID=1586708 RepID=UPI00147A2704|nr:hypothetical protein [Pandoraea sp. ISTKB]